MIHVKDNIYWVGVRDWGLRHFHGHELSTHRGSSYNSYIIKDEKTVLIDTVWDPYQEEFVDKLDRDIGVKNIDMIIINHIEPDHGGALAHLLDRMGKPDVPIYCTKQGAETISRHFHREFNFQIVKTGDSVSIGKDELVFVDMQMLHWPDSMLTYSKKTAVVFSNDAFGQHYSGLSLFADEVDTCEVWQESFKYFANILAPFTPLIKKKVEQIRAMNLPIEMIAPSHGVIWRENPMQIVDKYYEWSQEYHEGFAVIIYDTMYDATRWMAEAIAEGLETKGVNSKLFNMALTDVSDLLIDLFKAKAIIIGSCTINNSVLRPTAAILAEIKGHRLKGKIGAGFGSYGWSGEAQKHISDSLAAAGIKIVQEPLGVKYRPDAEDLKRCREFGANIGTAMQEK